MCGFFCVFSRTGRISEHINKIKKISNNISHRGPDSCGLFNDDFICLSFRRLSILDLSNTGEQPMTSFDNRYIIVFNGEIYNCLEIRSELEEKNIDSEELLIRRYFFILL